MFNLIVSNQDWASGQFSFSSERMFEYTAEAVAARFRNAQGPDFTALVQLPTLFMEEGRGDEVARIGRVLGVETARGDGLTVNCMLDAEVPGLPNRVVAEMAGALNMQNREFSRQHWAVKQVDLFRELLRRDLRRRVVPRVFQIADHETIERDLLSVMMPFAARFTPVYQALQTLCAELRLRCQRGDDIWRDNMVMQDVATLIDTSAVVVADCTERNPNVFYEIGIAHTLGHEVVLITQSPDDVPFNLRHLRYIEYSNTSAGLVTLTNNLRTRLNTLGFYAPPIFR